MVGTINNIGHEKHTYASFFIVCCLYLIQKMFNCKFSAEIEQMCLVKIAKKHISPMIKTMGSIVHLHIIIPIIIDFFMITLLSQ